MKRFTSTDKWEDAWHHRLPMAYKLAWSFVNDRCDHAGVFDIADDMMAVYLGDPGFTIEAFAQAAGPERLQRLSNGRWWLPKYCGFQNAGGISAKKKPHQPAIRSILKNQLPVLIGNDSEGTYRIHNEWVLNGYPFSLSYPNNRDVLPKSNVTVTSQEKEREKDKEKRGSAEGEIQSPPPAQLPPQIMVQPTLDEIRVDPKAELTRLTGVPWERVVALAGGFNAGAEQFTPDSLAEAYLTALAQRDMHVWHREGKGRLVSSMSLRGDMDQFVHREAIKRPDVHRLVRRSAAKPKADTIHAPCAWWREICQELYDGSDMHTVENWIDLPLSARQGIWGEFLAPVHTKAVSARHGR